MQVSGAGEPQDTVPQVFPVKKYEYKKKDEKTRHRQGRDERADQVFEIVEGCRLRRLHL